MTKLEEKLKELGYECYGLDGNGYHYSKKVNGNIGLIIYYDKTFSGKFNGWKVNYYPVSVETQQDIDNLQQAYNELQKDLEELRKYENN